MEKQVFQKVLNENKVKRPVFLNAIKAFITGGVICFIAQVILYLFKDKVGLPKDQAGTLIPITGFSNSMTSAALESKSEGIVLGIMTNMFKLAGAVIAAGVVSAFISGLIIYLVR